MGILDPFPRLLGQNEHPRSTPFILAPDPIASQSISALFENVNQTIEHKDIGSIQKWGTCIQGHTSGGFNGETRAFGSPKGVPHLRTHLNTPCAFYLGSVTTPNFWNLGQLK